MKLLLDQNLSRRLVERLQSLYPDTTQVSLVGLEYADDVTIWQYAKTHDYAIVTKDSDFHEYALLHGAPPKIVWLKCGNTSTQHTLHILVDNHSSIEAFLLDHEAYCLELY